MSQVDEADIREFIAAALTDPRVRDERFPFDRPKLRSEREPPQADATGQRPAAAIVTDR